MENDFKYEEVYLKDYESPREARKEINNFYPLL